MDNMDTALNGLEALPQVPYNDERDAPMLLIKRSAIVRKVGAYGQSNTISICIFELTFGVIA